MSDNTKDLSSSITENSHRCCSSKRIDFHNDATANLKTPVDRLNQNERKEIMIKLHEQGLFQKRPIPLSQKDSPVLVQATIYRYLEK